MKLSNETVSVLKNFSTINQNLVIKSGNKIATMSAMKNIVAKAEVITMPECEVKLNLSSDTLNEITKGASVIGAPDLAFECGKSQSNR